MYLPWFFLFVSQKLFHKAAQVGDIFIPIKLSDEWWEIFCFFVQIRSDTSQILDESIPLVKAKVREMNNIYTKIDKLEVCWLCY